MEFKSGVSIKPSDPIMQWMVRWAGMLLSRFRKDEEGVTPYERARGKKCKIETLAFGECVFFRKLSESRGSQMESRWSEGVWLGHARSSNEAWIGTTPSAIPSYLRDNSSDPHPNERIRALPQVRSQ